MREILKSVVGDLEREQTLVFATVVKTRGSTPAKVGAKFVVRGDDSSAGTVGGGCVEGDIWFIGREMLKNGTSFAYHEYTLNEDLAAETGLVCGGTAGILLELVKPSALPIFKRLLSAAQDGPALLLKTTVSSAPTVTADRQIVDDTAALAPFLREQAAALLRHGGAKPLTQDGIIHYLECYAPPPRVVIAGAGHVGKAIHDAARFAGLETVVFDDREEFLSGDRFEGAERHCVELENGFKKAGVKSADLLVICTRGHREDLRVCSAALKTDARYIGLLGSKRKSALVVKELMKRGCGEEQVSRLRAPVGVPIGAVTPEEIALSIVAEVVAVVRGAKPDTLSSTERFVAKELTALPN